jgi:adenosylmethionine-8-amino-7-oxononanoate aminotransferase
MHEPPPILASRTAYPVRGADYARIVEGRGPFLIGEDGRRYLDASSGSGSLIFGHGDAEMVAALASQAQTLTLFPSRNLGVEVVERYVAELVDFAPAGLDRALTFSSGSDAVEAAMKLALHYHFAAGRPSRTRIIGRQGSYHGNTLAGLGAGGFVARRAPYEPVLPRAPKPAAAHCTACQFGKTPDSCEVECAASVEAAILAEGADNVAAVILEPIVGAALSAATPDPRYLRKVRDICDRHGVLLIFDEVMTGFGRTGLRFGCEAWSVSPDILICGKGISAGYYPLSAVLASERVAEVFEGAAGPFQNGHTHSCSPVGAAVGLAVIERLRQGAALENAKAMGGVLRERLAGLANGGVIRNVRGEGLMIGFDVDAPDAAGPRQSRPAGEAADRLQRAALQRGLIVYGSSGSAGSRAGDHAMLLPPLTIGPEDVEFIAETLSAAARDLAESREALCP